MKDGKVERLCSNNRQRPLHCFHSRGNSINCLCRISVRYHLPFDSFCALSFFFSSVLLLYAVFGEEEVLYSTKSVLSRIVVTWFLYILVICAHCAPIQYIIVTNAYMTY